MPVCERGDTFTVDEIKLVEKQRETHRRMLEQLLMVEQAHKQALYKLEDEKRNHGEFMKKSDEFTNLLEQERERSVGGRGGGRPTRQRHQRLRLHTSGDDTF